MRRGVKGKTRVDILRNKEREMGRAGAGNQCHVATVEKINQTGRKTKPIRATTQEECKEKEKRGRNKK